MVPLMVVASSAEGPASSGSVPTMAMNTIAKRPTHACLQQQIMTSSGKHMRSVCVSMQQPQQEVMECQDVHCREANLGCV